MIFLFFNKFSCQLIKILIHKFNNTCDVAI